MNKLLILTLLVASLLTPVPSAAAGAVSQSGSGKQRGFLAVPFVRTELFFGARKPDGSEVSQAEWDGFRDTVITPEFPEGLTVLTGTGVPGPRRNRH